MEVARTEMKGAVQKSSRLGDVTSASFKGGTPSALFKVMRRLGLTGRPLSLYGRHPSEVPST